MINHQKSHPIRVTGKYQFQILDARNGSSRGYLKTSINLSLGILIDPLILE